MSEIMMNGLKVMGIGMGIVFAVLFILYVVVKVMSVIANKK